MKVLGLGGVGSIVARYACLFLHSLDQSSRLVLIDGDTFEPANATRMFFRASGNKAAVVRDELASRGEDGPVTLVAVEEFITKENCGRLIHDGDLVLLAVDNHATRKLVNDHCAQLREITLISGGNDGVESAPDKPARRGTYGNVQVYWRQQGADITPSLARYHPEIAQPADRHPQDLGCADLMASVPQLLFANCAVASAMLNTAWLYLSGALHYSELAFDIAEGLMRPTAVPGPKQTANV